MLDESIFEKDTYYEEDIKKIASKKIWERATVRGVGLSRRTIQQAYKDMKKYDFQKGNIIDFLGFVCLANVLMYFIRAFDITSSVKKALVVLEVFFNWNNHTRIVISRLLLKDDKYMDYTFSQMENLIGLQSLNSEALSIEAWNFMNKEIEKYLRSELKEQNTFIKLKKS
jgi:hypothetical protein